MSSFHDDPLEERMKSTIAQWFRDEQVRKLDMARSLAASLEAENAQLELDKANLKDDIGTLERALFEAEREIERLNLYLKNTVEAYHESLAILEADVSGEWDDDE